MVPAKSVLVETYFAKLEPLEEAASADPSAPKKMRVSGLYQKGNVVNGNRRKYPTELLAREVSGLQESIKSRSVYMAVDHPAGTSASLRDAGAILTRLEMRGDEVIGEAEVLNTSAGRDLQEIIRAGGRIGISSRGSGSVKTESREDGSSYELVCEDFNLISFDFVGEPSLASAGITSHVEEAKGGSLKMDIKTLAELKEKFPAIAEALRKEVAGELSADVETKLAKRVSEEVAKLESKVKAQILAEQKINEESDDELLGRVGVGRFALLQNVQSMLAKAGYQVSLTGLNSQLQADDPNKKQGVDGVPGRISGYQTAPGAGDPTAAGSALEALKKSQSDLMEKVLGLDAQLRKKDIETFINEAVKAFPEIIRDDVKVRLMACESLEEAKTAAAVELKHIEQVAKKLGAPSGKGRQFAPEANPEKGALQEDKEMQTWARLCGLES